MPDRLTHDALVEVFGEDAVARVAPGAVPAGITDEAARAFLTEVGVPTSTTAEFIVFDKHVPDGPLPLRESPFVTEHGWTVPPSLADAYLLGDAYGSVFVTIALDGATGRVYAISEAEPDPYLMNSDLESLVYFAYVLERDRELYTEEHFDEHEADYEGTGSDPFQEAARLTERAWREHDPAAFEVPEGEIMKVWPNVLDDIASGTFG
ncbi:MULTISPECIES: SUKH-4 family immunity protein [Actinomadura]|uniref:SUKH-4 family immunity protein n=1 Tax=Actinomadura yumaensis TaxID=111807 RepID=A0ABW2CF67_9ACTN|nr:SUKH-4 family immunity protein [Actinomadura sp. J1-007]MWK34512.1 hypothetical protein [Actinomadura sp. J1-007]